MLSTFTQVSNKRYVFCGRWVEIASVVSFILESSTVRLVNFDDHLGFSVAQRVLFPIMTFVTIALTFGLTKTLNWSYRGIDENPAQERFNAALEKNDNYLCRKSPFGAIRVGFASSTTKSSDTVAATVIECFANR